MVDSCGRSVSVCAAMAAEARAFGTFRRTEVSASEGSGIVAAVGSTLTRLLRVWAADGVMELIEILSRSLELSNDRGDELYCWG